MTCAGVIIDHDVDMNYQYWLHPKTKWPHSSFEIQIMLICYVQIAKMGSVQDLSRYTLKLVFDDSPVNLKH